MSVSAPQYESPGGTVPAIVTLYDAPRNAVVDISAAGTGGATASCVGQGWRNERRRTFSRKCYLRLPLRPGAYRVRARARAVRAGAGAVVRWGEGARPVRADGYPSPQPMSIAAITAIERCHNASDHVWLTFDDGGSPAQVRRILATLHRKRVRGRFFFTGRWAAGHPALMRRIAAEGHGLGNHSAAHPALSRVPAAAVRDQIDRGVRPPAGERLLRPPFAAGALTRRLERIAAARGYRLCRWTVDTYDWQGPSPARMAERVRHGDELTPPVEAGGNILMHAGGTHTATGLPRVIDAVRARGLTLEPLDPHRDGRDAPSTGRLDRPDDGRSLQ